MPGTDLMPSGAMETFTGSNGSAPNATNITLALNQGSGGGITIQGNQLRIRTGTTQFNRTSVRLTGISLADWEVEFDWVVPSNSINFAQMMCRGGNSIDANEGYIFSLEPNDMTVTRHNPVNTYSGPSLVTDTHGFTTGQLVRTRVAMFGYRIRSRTWLVGDPEPTSVWQIDYTDPSGSGGINQAGAIGWSTSSATSGSKDFFVDNIDLHDTITPSQATLFATGGITPTGVLVKQPRKLFAGAMTPAGALTKSRAVTRSFAGAITPAGALMKSLPRNFAGVITPAGVLKRQPNKKFVGAVTPAGATRKSMIKTFAGSIAPTGAAVVTFVGRIFGRPGLVVMKLLERAEVRIRHRNG